MLARASRLAARGLQASSPPPAPSADVPEIFKPAVRNGVTPVERAPEPAPAPEPEPAPEPPVRNTDRRRAPGQTKRPRACAWPRRRWQSPGPAARRSSAACGSSSASTMRRSARRDLWHATQRGSMTMTYSSSDQPSAGGSPDLRRSVGEATRADPRDHRRRRAGGVRHPQRRRGRGAQLRRRAAAARPTRAAEERSGALDQWTRFRSPTPPRRSSTRRSGCSPSSTMRSSRPAPGSTAMARALRSRTSRPRPAPGADPLSMDREPFAVESLARERETRTRLARAAGAVRAQGGPLELPPLDPAELRSIAGSPSPSGPRLPRSPPIPAAPIAPGAPTPRRPAPTRPPRPCCARPSSRVTGKDRDEIADVLRADFPSVDTEPLLDEILG